MHTRRQWWKTEKILRALLIVLLISTIKIKSLFQSMFVLELKSRQPSYSQLHYKNCLTCLRKKKKCMGLPFYSPQKISMNSVTQHPSKALIALKSLTQKMVTEEGRLCSSVTLITWRSVPNRLILQTQMAEL